MLSHHYTDPICNLSLSTRVYNVLKREIHTINALLNCSKEDILKFKNLGRKSLDEIFSMIDQLNKNKVLIYSEKSTKELQIKTFIGSDGHKYKDIPIEDLNLSVRALNCLKSEKINYYSQLHIISAAELIVFVTWVKKLFLKENVKSNTPLTLSSDIEDNNYNIFENICSRIFTKINENLM